MSKIRLALKEDIPSINRLLIQVNNVHAYLYPSIFKKDTKKYSDIDLEDIIINKSKTNPILVYQEANQVLGYAFLIINEIKENNNLQYRKELYIDDLCVDSSYRNKGIASLLIDEVIKYAKQNKCTEITLNVYLDNKVALDFYNKKGFKPLKSIFEMKI